MIFRSRAGWRGEEVHADFKWLKKVGCRKVLLITSLLTKSFWHCLLYFPNHWPMLSSTECDNSLWNYYNILRSTAVPSPYIPYITLQCRHFFFHLPNARIPLVFHSPERFEWQKFPLVPRSSGDGNCRLCRELRMPRFPARAENFGWREFPLVPELWVTGIPAFVVPPRFVFPWRNYCVQWSPVILI